MIGAKEYKKLWDMIKPLKFGMLCTMDQGELRARPMTIVQDDFEGSLFFFTNKNTHKAQEVKARHAVNVSFTSLEDQTYVSLSGEADICKDKTLVDKFWNPMVETYFPKGKEDPELALMEIRVTSAEYWDASESKMSRLFEVGTAYVRGTPPDLGDHKSYQ